MEPEARLGSTLAGKWRLEALLGVGGMGAVYAARHRNGRRFAVKVLHPGADAELRARFVREGYIANRIDHPGVVAILDDDVADDDTPFLVMELLEGECLEEWALSRGKRLPMPRLLGHAVSLLEVLERAHAAGVVHRDLKPENLFATRDGALKVLDFGIARLRESGAVAPASSTANVILGTLGYMAPEQARGRWDEVDARTDLWAVGATLFALVTGENVHVAARPNEVFLAAMSQPARSLAVVAPETPPPFAAIVDRALAFDRESRWRNARVMREAILEAQASINMDATGAAEVKRRLDPEADAPAFVATATDPPLARTKMSLSELASRAGLTPRSVRYFIQRGMLPGPVTDGDEAWYDEAHVTRLRALGGGSREGT